MFHIIVELHTKAFFEVSVRGVLHLTNLLLVACLVLYAKLSLNFNLRAAGLLSVLILKTRIRL